MSQNVNKRPSEVFPYLTGFSGKNKLIWKSRLFRAPEFIQCELIISPYLLDTIGSSLEKLDKTIPGDPKEESDIRYILTQFRYNDSPIFFWSEKTDGYVDVDEIIDISPGSNIEGDYYIQLIAEGIPTQVHIMNICQYYTDVGVMEEGSSKKKLL